MARELESQNIHNSCASRAVDLGQPKRRSSEDATWGGSTQFSSGRAGVTVQVIDERPEQLAGLLSQSVAIGLVQPSISVWQVSQVWYTVQRRIQRGCVVGNVCKEGWYG